MTEETARDHSEVYLHEKIGPEADMLVRNGQYHLRVLSE